MKYCFLLQIVILVGCAAKFGSSSDPISICYDDLLSVCGFDPSDYQIWQEGRLCLMENKDIISIPCAEFLKFHPSIEDSCYDEIQDVCADFTTDILLNEKNAINCLRTSSQRSQFSSRCLDALEAIEHRGGATLGVSNKAPTNSEGQSMKSSVYMLVQSLFSILSSTPKANALWLTASRTENGKGKAELLRGGSVRIAKPKRPIGEVEQQQQTPQFDYGYYGYGDYGYGYETYYYGYYGYYGYYDWYGYEEGYGNYYYDYYYDYEDGQYGTDDYEADDASATTLADDFYAAPGSSLGTRVQQKRPSSKKEG